MSILLESNLSYKKCGEIMTTFQFDKQLFTFVCLYCPQKWMTAIPQDFIQHIIEHERWAIKAKQSDSKCEDKFSLEDSKAIQNVCDPLEDSMFDFYKSEEVQAVDNNEENNGQTDRIPCGDVNFKISESETANECDDDPYCESVDAACSESNEDDDKELISALIEGYEKLPLLWNDSEPMAKNRKKREEALKKLTKQINKRFGQRLKWKIIGDRIKKLCYRYRSELFKQQLAEKKGQIHNPIWYFSKLSFLKNVIKERQKPNTNTSLNEKLALPLPKLSDAENRQLIEIYESFPCLWKVEHIEFHFKNQRQKAIEEMLTTIREKMQLTLTPNKLQKNLYAIRFASTQEKRRKLDCERLGIVYKPVCKFYDEISFLIDNVGPFQCTFCSEIFKGIASYKIHKSKHDGSMPFTCSLCDRGFMKLGNCMVHLRRHTRDYSFECEFCDKRFATSTDIKVHMRHHTKEKPYFCEICGQSCRTWTFFDAHMRRHQKRPSHTCKICGKAFYENHKLSLHMKAHLNIRDKACNVCGKAFTNSKYLRQHKEIHAEEKKYVCKICCKTFAQNAGLTGHMKSHGTTINSSIAVTKDKE